MPEVIYQYQQGHMLDDGKILHSWVDCSEEYCESEKAEGGVVRILYTVAPPAVLPPEKISLNNGVIGFNEGYNKCRSDALALGAQQQKVVELPDPADDSLLSTWQFNDAVINALDAAGVKWEVKK